MTRKDTFIFRTLSLVFLSLVCLTSHAQNSQIQSKLSKVGINTITTAVPFLLIAPDARGGGMGDVGVADLPDANSIHWNASKLAFVDKKAGFATSYTPWLHALVPDINLAYLSGYLKVDRNQAIGISMLYFSLGNITFTDPNNQEIGSFTPNEYCIDFAYSRKLAPNFSGGLTLRYIHSNLTGGVIVEGTTPSKPGVAAAADLSGYYENTKVKVQGKKSRIAAGINISNIGNKIAYSNTGNKDFLPTNLKLGGAFTLDLDQYNSASIYYDMNKLLVPTPPVYEIDPVTNGPKYDANGAKVVAKGKSPNVGVPQGITQSFSDAPGGMKEEFHEINHSVGIEYWYDKQFAVRTGIFYEHPSKGNRKFITVGAGLKYNVFGLDFAYLIPLEQKNPLENTLRFTLLFDFDAFKSQNKTEDSN